MHLDRNSEIPASVIKIKIMYYCVLATKPWQNSQNKRWVGFIMLNVTFILCQQMLATSLTLPLEQLHAAEAMAQSHQPPSKHKKSSLNVRFASVDGAPVSTHTGIHFAADCTLEEATENDIVYLPALWRNPKRVMKANAALLPWLQQQFENGCLIAGVGTSCFLMAEAGLLNNKPATTHWHYFDEFHRRYPLVNLKRQHFITQAGNLFCTGSVNSLADLTIHFIQRYYSRTIASHVERHFFHEIRRAYESSVSYQDSADAHPDEDILQIQIWLQDNYGKEINLQELAKSFDLSVRTFNRRFKAATGLSPLNYLQKIRLENAKDLLKTTNLSIGEVMFKIGYHDTAYFHALFKKHHGTTPGQYRTTVRAKLFSLS